MVSWARQQCKHNNKSPRLELRLHWLRWDRCWIIVVAGACPCRQAPSLHCMSRQCSADREADGMGTLWPRDNTLDPRS